jgi:hypothetical protein
MIFPEDWQAVGAPPGDRRDRGDKRFAGPWPGPDAVRYMSVHS